jgi:hypothetical protein
VDALVASDEQGQVNLYRVLKEVILKGEVGGEFVSVEGVSPLRTLHRIRRKVLSYGR